MQTKTYFASSVPAALELARKELGEEAMLVTSKPSSPEGRPYGRLEVTFAFERVAASVRRAAEYPNFAAASRVPTERTYDAGPQSEMDDIRRQISELKLAVTRPNQRIPASADIAPERIPVALRLSLNLARAAPSL
jgi:flagellar biosynthesis GTPase FlhF